MRRRKQKQPFLAKIRKRWQKSKKRKGLHLSDILRRMK